MSAPRAALAAACTIAAHAAQWRALLECVARSVLARADDSLEGVALRCAHADLCRVPAAPSRVRASERFRTRLRMAVAAVRLLGVCGCATNARTRSSCHAVHAYPMTSHAGSLATIRRGRCRVACHARSLPAAQATTHNSTPSPPLHTRVCVAHVEASPQRSSQPRPSAHAHAATRRSPFCRLKPRWTTPPR